MPSRKVSTVIIICIAIIISIWVITRNSNANLATLGNDSVSAFMVENNENANDEWKKILVDINTKNQEVLVDLTNKPESTFDDTTITAQISQDFMSQYIILKNSGKELTQEEIGILAQKVMSDPKYTEISGAEYKASNLNINNNTDKNTINTYKDRMTAIIKAGLSKPKEDPAIVVLNVLKTEKYEELSKLDHIILANKTAITELINVPVPRIAVNIHLALLNSLSNILSDLEAMRVLETDPMRSFIAINQYDANLSNLMNALSTMSRYLAVR